LTGETIDSAFRIPHSAIEYGYDGAGNRLTRSSDLPTLESASYAYDANDRLTTDTYDANGNTLVGRLPSAAVVTDSYDSENRLITRHSSFATLHFQYDGDGHRVSKTIITATATNTTWYVVDDLNPTGHAQVLEELSTFDVQRSTFNVQLPTPEVTCAYTWGDTLISQDRFDGAAWTASFYGHDAHQSVRYLTDTQGRVTDTYDYDAFGTLIDAHTRDPNTGGWVPLSTLDPRLSTPNSSLATRNSYLFRGEQFDPDLGLYYLRARYANPDTGRFWTADTFEGFADDPPSLHRYAFNHNDPVNRHDPTGHFSMAEMSGVAGLTPMVRGLGMDLFSGTMGYAYGLSGGSGLKATSRAEAYMIDSLAQGAGWQLGKAEFWTVMRGAPFLLSWNPNITPTPKPCYYECITFDEDVPIYGPAAQHPMFEFKESELANEVLDLRRGAIVGATLRALGEDYSHLAGSSRDPYTVFMAGSFGDLAQLGAGAVSPQSYLDFYQRAEQLTTVVTDRELGQGSPWWWAGTQGLSAAAGEMIPYNRIMEGIFGVDRLSLTPLDGVDRSVQISLGVSQLAGMFAGLGKSYTAERLAARAAESAEGAATVLGRSAGVCRKPGLLERYPALDPGWQNATAAVRYQTSRLVAAAEAFGEGFAESWATSKGRLYSDPTLGLGSGLGRVTEAAVDGVRAARQAAGDAAAEGALATARDQAAFWSGRSGLNRAAAEGSRLTTLERTPAGLALESQDLFSKLPYLEAIQPWEVLSEQFAIQARGTVNAWTGGAAPLSIWNRVELPTLLRNPEVRRIIIHDATQPWRTEIIYK
jgi:RHS repeat-associated protein